MKKIEPATEQRNNKGVEEIAVGRMDYMDDKGRIYFSEEYTDEEKFTRRIREADYYGEPATAVIYRDGDSQKPRIDFKKLVGAEGDDVTSIAGMRFEDGPGLVMPPPVYHKKSKKIDWER